MMHTRHLVMQVISEDVNGATEGRASVDLVDPLRSHSVRLFSAVATSHVLITNSRVWCHTPTECIVLILLTLHTVLLVGRVTTHTSTPTIIVYSCIGNWVGEHRGDGVIRRMR